MPLSTPSTAACRIPLCAIVQLAQLKILSPLLTLKIDLKKNSLPHIMKIPKLPILQLAQLQILSPLLTIK
jgi:hypothetical protein